MTDKEILAELKKCYELIEDILDNQYNQLEDTKELLTILKILQDKYCEMYKKIEHEDNTSLYYKCSTKISPYINADYINAFRNYINAEDLNERKWWEDYDFLTNF